MKSGTSLQDLEQCRDQPEDVAGREGKLLRGRRGRQEKSLCPDREGLALRRENLHLRRELVNLQQAFQALQRRQEQLLALVERYKKVIQEFRGFLSPVEPGYPRED